VFDRDEGQVTRAETFGRWLLRQRDRGDWVDALAESARTDRRFPKDGDPDVVRQYMSTMQADGDVFAAIDDAELDWMSY
jgi:uncharacterized protein YozE (UPF0346 family)